MKLPDIKWSGVLPEGSASPPGKDSNHFDIASLDPNQGLGFSLTGVLRRREANRSTQRIGKKRPPAQGRFHIGNGRLAGQKKAPEKKDVSTILRGHVCVSVKPNLHFIRGVKGAKTLD